MSDCKPPKRTLGISLNPPSIGVECGCWDAVIIPIPATLLLKSLPESVIKKAGAKFAPGAIRSAVKNKLRALLGPILDRLEQIPIAIARAEDSIIAKSQALAYLADSLIKIKANLDSIKNRMNLLATQLLDRYRELKELNKAGVSSPPLSMSDYLNDPRIGPPAGVLAYIEQLEKFVKIRKGPDGKYRPVGGSLYDEYNVEESRIKSQLDEYAKTKKNLEEKIAEEQKSITDLTNEQTENNNAKSRYENLIARADTEDPETLLGLVGDIVVQGATILSSILDLIIAILSVFEFVQKHTCTDSATLNEDTCRCQCRDDEEICDQTNTVKDFLPRLPGFHQSDELSTCHPKCCGGQQWENNGCFCYCPYLNGPNGNRRQELKPCTDKSKTNCDNGKICGTVLPPDVDPNAWFPPPSKYEWSSTECKWVCKNKTCPEGQKLSGNPLEHCVCRCKDAEEAGCYPPKTWKTEYNSSGEVVSCECIPCEPNCPNPLSCGDDGCEGQCPCPPGAYICASGTCVHIEPQDCVVDWSDWSECSASCGGGTQTRTGTIVTPESGGGEPCPELSESRSCNTQACPPPPDEPQDCVVSDWSDWSECSATCGGGTQSRTRSVVTPASNGGSACPELSESRSCNTQACPPPPPPPNPDSCVCSFLTDPFQNGVPSNGSVWTGVCIGNGCQGSCSKTFEIDTGNFNWNQYCSQDCVVGNWSDWGECSATCDGGTQSRNRAITTSPSNGGEPCPELSESRSCNTQACPPPQDCVVSDWSWGECSVACGGGTQLGTRTVTTPASNGGEPCPELSESRSCNTQACPPCQIDCGSSNGDGYCGLPDGCGGVCQCTEPNYYCDNYSCIPIPTPTPTPTADPPPPICGVYPFDSDGIVGFSGGLPDYSHCADIYRCLTTTVTSNIYVWKWSQSYGTLDGVNCECNSLAPGCPTNRYVCDLDLECPPSDYVCDSSNYGKWLVSFCKF